jgi:hypothetical protein
LSPGLFIEIPCRLENIERNLTECIFHDGSDNCWSLVSPFKMRRRPSLLLKDTAERCLCLSIPCTECEYYED